MKKLFLSAWCFFAALGLLFIGTACGKTDDNLASIEISKNEGVVLKGSEITGLKVNAVYRDDTKGNLVDVTKEMLAGYDKTKTGMQTVKVTFMGKEITFDIYVADKIVATATELRSALKAQADGEVIALKEGNYDIDRDQEVSYQNGRGFYCLISASNITLKGIGDVTVKSSTESENADWESQNFVTIVGNHVTIDNINLQSKTEPNKVIEVLGSDAKIMNLNISPMNQTKFAGTIYLSTKSGNTLIENVNLKYGRISTTGAQTGATLSLKGVTIDFANAYMDEETTESSFWGFDNSRSKITVTAANSKVIVSKAFKATNHFQTFMNQIPSGLTVEEAK